MRLNKNQDDISAQSHSYVKTAEEFDLLMKHIENTLKEAGSEILKGNADIAPYKLKDETACKILPIYPLSVVLINIYPAIIIER